MLQIIKFKFKFREETKTQKGNINIVQEKKLKTYAKSLAFVYNV